MYNPFNRAEESAIMRYVFSIIDEDLSILQSEKSPFNLFGFTKQDLMNAVVMDKQEATRILSLMSSEKKQLTSSLLIAIAMADAVSEKEEKENINKCYSILKECSLPLNVSFSDSLRIAHEFVDR